MCFNRDRLILKFEEHTTGVAQAVSELATLFPEVSVMPFQFQKIYPITSGVNKFSGFCLS